MTTASRALAGRVVLITGGARGIGAATARRFTAAGATVAIADVTVDENTDRPAATAVVRYRLDVTDPAQFGDVVDAVERDLGPLDILVNNAGIMPVAPFATETVESIERQLSINIAGVIYGCQHALRKMLPRHRGHIINMASAAGKIGYPGVATYSATKFAVVGLTDTLALEYADTGVEFTCVMPGLVNTELSAGITEHWMLKNCDPDRVAQAIVDAVHTKQLHVHVPRRLGPINILHSLLPRRAGERVMRLLGADHQILDAAGAPGRRAYDARVASTPHDVAVPD